ncbi:MAG: DNA alkylation repair protein [Bryobacteraceae bacterium]
MTAQEIVAALQSLGTEQNRKVYARHGSGPNVFGVSFANLEKLRKQIKRDHALAAELWSTGNFDACNLATMIADPGRMTAKDLDHWAKRIGNSCLAGLFARNIASKTAFAKEKAERWSESKDELTGEAGYGVLGCLAMNDRETADAYFEEWLGRIEAGIHQAPNRVRYAMNNAVIAIGIRNPRLRKLALAAAGRIGKVHVDHGETDCKTPDAAAYIKKAAGRARGAS